MLKELREVDFKTPFSLVITPIPSTILKEARELDVDALRVELDVASPTLLKK